MRFLFTHINFGTLLTPFVCVMLDVIVCSTFESTEYVSEMKCTVQSVEERVNMYVNSGGDKWVSLWDMADALIMYMGIRQYT